MFPEYKVNKVLYVGESKLLAIVLIIVKNKNHNNYVCMEILQS